MNRHACLPCFWFTHIFKTQVPPAFLTASWASHLRYGATAEERAAVQASEGKPLHKYNTIKTYLSATYASCTEHGKKAPPVDNDLKLSLIEWEDDDDVNEADAFEFDKHLPKMWSACFSMSFWSAFEQLRVWTMLLVAISMFARASDVTQFCPLMEHTRLPPKAQWDPDGYPKWIELGFAGLETRLKQEQNQEVWHAPPP